MLRPGHLLCFTEALENYLYQRPVYRQMMMVGHQLYEGVGNCPLTPPLSQH